MFETCFAHTWVPIKLLAKRILCPALCWNSAEWSLQLPLLCLTNHQPRRENAGWIYTNQDQPLNESCPTLCDPTDCIVHGILQARILEWVAFPFSRGSSQPRDRTQVSRIAAWFFTSWATREAQLVILSHPIWGSFNKHTPKCIFLILINVFHIQSITVPVL